ncbi:MAG: hypothetical protein ACI308_07030 [Muribaculaceae bacterium]
MRRTLCVLLFVLLMHVCGYEWQCSAAEPCKAVACAVANVHTRAHASDFGGTLRGCSQDVTMMCEASSLTLPVSVRVCHTRPVRLLPVRCHTWRGGSVASQNHSLKRQAVQPTATEPSSASIVFPLCILANDRIVALRRIVR